MCIKKVYVVGVCVCIVSREELPSRIVNYSERCYLFKIGSQVFGFACRALVFDIDYDKGWLRDWGLPEGETFFEDLTD